MGKQNVAEFPFPSPPEKQQIEAAEKHLVQLGALEPDSLKITPLGRTAKAVNTSFPDNDSSTGGLNIESYTKFI